MSTTDKFIIEILVPCGFCMLLDYGVHFMIGRAWNWKQALVFFGVGALVAQLLLFKWLRL